MNLFVTCFILAALLYVLTLPFVGKRAKKHARKNKEIEIEDDTHENLYK